MKYAIAYGRNLDLRRMAEKCPHCVLAGKTVLKDWQIAFGKVPKPFDKLCNPR